LASETVLHPDAAAAAAAVRELCDFLAPSQAEGELGRLGSYRVLRVLGAGGMGVVFLAEDPQLERRVALKAMRPALISSDSAKKRFFREAKTTASIKHDHIITIYQVGEDRGAPFLAMEFLEGESLEERLQRSKKLPLDDVLRMGREIAEGLAEAHKHGLIHRDIKPANIWLEGRRSRVKVLDFGLARATGDETHLTQPGTILGTPAYMAPEQARGEEVDARGDLFSLGCVLYRMATGELPFTGNNLMSLIRALEMHHPTPPAQRHPDVPPSLSGLIMKLLAKDRNERPSSAEEVVAALESFEKDGTRPPAVQPVGKARRRLLLAGAGVGLLAILVLLAVVLTRKTPTERGEEASGGSAVLPSGGEAAHDAKPPAGEEAWRQSIAAMSPDEQVQAVAHRLKERNPGFDGQVVKHLVEDGKVVWLEFSSDSVLDLSPVRALTELKVLGCYADPKTGSKLTDLSPLIGLPLERLVCHFTAVQDLSTLHDMPLVSLDISGTKVKDLTPLAGLRLTHLECAHTPVADFSPLKGMPLRELSCDFNADRDGALLRSIKTLETLNGKPVAAFWKEDDKAIPNRKGTVPTDD
jgi:predicted Ser/Thr protein kinase